MRNFPRLKLFSCYALLLTFYSNQVFSYFINTVRRVQITRSETFGANFADRIIVTALSSSSCTNITAINAELNANCVLASQHDSSNSQSSCSFECTCQNETGSFVVHEKRCVNERRLQDCAFVFGSWSWSTGWIWNTQTDPLQIVFVEENVAFSGGFNASVDEFSQCISTSIATQDSNGEWMPFTTLANESTITFFKMRGYWHLIWTTEGFSEDKISEIKGRFVRMDVTCENSNEISNGVVTLQSSCLLFKATGNMSHEYNITVVQPAQVVHQTTLFMSTTVPTVQSPIHTTLMTSYTSKPTSTIVIPFVTITSSSTPQVSISTITEIPTSAERMTSSREAESSLFIHGRSSLWTTNSGPVRGSVLQSSSEFASGLTTQSSQTAQNNSVIRRISALESTILRTTVIESDSLSFIFLETHNSRIVTTPVNNEISVIASSSRHIIGPSSSITFQSSNDSQISLIVGIVVAASAAVFFTIAAIVLTVTSLRSNHVKRTQVRHHLRRNYAMKEFANFKPDRV